MKSQAIFKSIEKLSDSRILDIYLRVLKKKNERQEHWKPPRRAPDGNQCFICSFLVLFYFNPKRKTKKRKGSRKGSGFETKKKKRKRRKKKNTLQDSNPRPSDLSFPAPHTIRPRAHGRVTSFPAYTNLTDKEINKDIYMTVNSTRDFIPPEPFEGQNYKPRYARPSASLREE